MKKGTLYSFFTRPAKASEPTQALPTANNKKRSAPSSGSDDLNAQPAKTPKTSEHDQKFAVLDPSAGAGSPKGKSNGSSGAASTTKSNIQSSPSEVETTKMEMEMVSSAATTATSTATTTASSSDATTSWGAGGEEGR